MNFSLFFIYSDDLLNYEAEDLLDEVLLDDKIDEDELLLSDEGKCISQSCYKIKN